MQGSDMISWVGSMLGLIAFLRGVLPMRFIYDFVYKLLDKFSSDVEVVVSETKAGKANELYKHVERYLSSVTFGGSRKSHAFLGKNMKKFSYHPAPDETIDDIFCGSRMEWIHGCAERKSQNEEGGETDEKRWYTLRMSRFQKDALLEKYLEHIVQIAKKLHRGNRELRIYSNRTRYSDVVWDHVTFRHPASFDTIALEPELKRSIIEDLEDFTSSEELYRSFGKPWKRGYLLFGPPGTGKTSLVAAMAKKLHYDIYDLELTEVRSNSDLKRMLLETSSKSVIVIEDIDCSLDLAETRNKAKRPEQSDSKSSKLDRPTLSGLLNFTDGLWSSIENERIFVFTSNHIEKLDPALLRSGRMDMHIYLGFCNFASFKLLAKTFLKIDDDVERYPQVEALLGDVTNISPSEVAELLMRNRKNADYALDNLLDVLRDRKANPRPAQPEQFDQDSVDDVDEKWETSADGRDGKVRPESGIKME